MFLEVARRGGYSPPKSATACDVTRSHKYIANDIMRSHMNKDSSLSNTRLCEWLLHFRFKDFTVVSTKSLPWFQGDRFFHFFDPLGHNFYGWSPGRIIVQTLLHQWPQYFSLSYHLIQVLLTSLNL